NSQKQALNKLNGQLKVETEAATRFRYLAQMNLAHHLWNEGDAVQVHAVLERQPRDLRGWEWHYLNQLVRDAEKRTLIQHTQPVNRVAFSPTGRYLASAGADRRVVVQDLVEKKTWQ